MLSVRLRDLPSFEIGYEEGVEKGIEKGIEKIVKQMLLNMDEQTVSKSTGLPLSVVQNLNENK